MNIRSFIEMKPPMRTTPENHLYVQIYVDERTLFKANSVWCIEIVEYLISSIPQYILGTWYLARESIGFNEGKNWISKPKNVSDQRLSNRSIAKDILALYLSFWRSDIVFLGLWFEAQKFPKNIEYQIFQSLKLLNGAEFCKTVLG